MVNRSKREVAENLRSGIMGFGKESMRNSYYSDFLERGDQLERYRSLLDTVEEAVALLSDDTLHFVDMNAGSCRLFEKSEEELRNISFKNLVDFEEKILHKITPVQNGK